jgi:amidase
MATADKMQTTAGSLALLNSTVPRDAHIVGLLREAGAIIIGHSNMDEWASIRSTVHSSGFSPRLGQTRNPYDLSKAPSMSFPSALLAGTTADLPTRTQRAQAEAQPSR